MPIRFLARPQPLALPKSNCDAPRRVSVSPTSAPGRSQSLSATKNEVGSPLAYIKGKREEEANTRTRVHHHRRSDAARHLSPQNDAASHHSPLKTSASHGSFRKVSGSHISSQNVPTNPVSPRNAPTSHSPTRKASASHVPLRKASASGSSFRKVSTSHIPPLNVPVGQVSPRNASTGRVSPRNAPASHKQTKPPVHKPPGDAGGCAALGQSVRSPLVNRVPKSQVTAATVHGCWQELIVASAQLHAAGSSPEPLLTLHNDLCNRLLPQPASPSASLSMAAKQGADAAVFAASGMAAAAAVAIVVARNVIYKQRKALQSDPVAVALRCASQVDHADRQVSWSFGSTDFDSPRLRDLSCLNRPQYSVLASEMSFGPSSIHDGDAAHSPSTAESTSTLAEVQEPHPVKAVDGPHPSALASPMTLCPGSFDPKLADAELFVPWKETEKLTKLNSVMLRMGLHFDVVLHDLHQDYNVHLLALAHPGRSSLEGLAGANQKQQAARLQEIRRQQELQARIENRERRRELAKHHSEETRRREVDGLRVAMWQTICKLLAHSLPERHAMRLQYDRFQQFVLLRWRLHVHRIKRRKQREVMLRSFRSQFNQLMPEQLRATGPLFQGWPEEKLESFIAELFPCTFAAGDYICHQGDPSDVLYVLVIGAVDVVIRKPNCHGKGRGRQSGITVAQLQPIKYFGEYGVFADEPRAASLYCSAPVLALASTRECLVRHLKSLAPTVYQQISATFEANMSKIYKVRPAQLANSVLFKGWDVETLTEVAAKMEPVCFPENTNIAEEGSPGTAVYFIAKGRCRTMRAGKPHILSAGDMIGMRASVFVEPHQYDVQSINTVQAWRLPKAVLMDFMLMRPDQFLATKARLNEEHAKLLVKPSLDELLSQRACEGLPRALLERLYSHHLHPVIVEPRAAVVRQGEEVQHLLFITHGNCLCDGAALSGQGLCLGLDEVLRHTLCWEKTIFAQERVEGWTLRLGDVMNATEQQKLVPRQQGVRKFLGDVASLCGPQTKSYPAH